MSLSSASPGGTSPGLLSKRAKELQQSEPVSASARSTLSRTPPHLLHPSSGDVSLANPVTSLSAALPTVQEDVPVLSHPPGITRRPRAGTLPSTFHIGSSVPPVTAARQHLASHHHLGLPTSSGMTASLPGSGATTPISEYPYTLRDPSPTNHARLRSGSLTLPSSGLSMAFGSSAMFTTAPSSSTLPANLGWPSATGSSLSSTPQTSADSSMDSIRSREESVTSPDSSAYGEESHVRTLDYLGLDGEDSPVPGPDSGGRFSMFDSADSGPTQPHHPNGRPISHSLSVHHLAPGMSRLGSAGSIGAPSSLLSGHSPSENEQSHQGRMRSNTVAVFPRSAPTSLNNTAPPGQFQVNGVVVEDSDLYNASAAELGGSANFLLPPQNVPASLAQHLLYETTASTANTPLSAVSATSRLDAHSPSSAARARAATIGILDGEGRETLLRKRAGTMAASGGTNGGNAGAEEAAFATNGLPDRLRGLSLSREEAAWATRSSPPPVHPPPSISPNPPLPAAPPTSSSLPTPPPQTPTRALWIGNLSPSITPSALQALFAPYGPIESLRLIPEKECAFVNFVRLQDAERAKAEVLERLSAAGVGKGLGGMVRIGYGKADQLVAATAAAGGVGAVQNVGVGGGADGGMFGGGQPTRALWVGSIPAQTPSNVLLAIFAPFGSIESARVLTHKSCGFINFDRLEDAMAARKTLNGREILGPEVGAVRIGFAKAPSRAASASPVNGILDPLALTDPYYAGGAYPTANVFGSSEREGEGEVEVHETVVLGVEEMQTLMRELASDDPENEEHVRMLAERPQATYHHTIPQTALVDPSVARRYVNADAPRLRELRKRLDAVECGQSEVDEIALSLLPECIALSSDYIGNTLVQKVFERASFSVRIALLERIAPHLATIGTHKNGTWAVQKIIQSVQEPEEYDLIQRHLQPYTPPLLLNDFGNYVVQGALRFGPPRSDFIFDAMVDRCWEIGSGRFGARSTRQTLESPLASRFHIKRVALAIASNAVPLALSANGALLITWLIETSDFTGRWRLLASQFAPELVKLCTHKLASLSVLKVINQRLDIQASKVILDALFSRETGVLEEILGDQVHGTQSLSRIISSPYIEPNERASVHERIRAGIVQMRVEAVPAYRRLMEELGMPFRGPAPPSSPAPHFTASYLPHQQHQYPARPPLSPYAASASGSPPLPSWSPQLGYPSYPAQFDYSQYGMYPPYQPYGPGANYGFPQNAGPPRPQGYALHHQQPYQPHGQPMTSRSPMLAPVPVSSAVSPAVVPAGLPAISSPDPFSVLRVNSTDSASGFNPSFSSFSSPTPAAYPYFAGPPPFYPADAGYSEYATNGGRPQHR